MGEAPWLVGRKEICTYLRVSWQTIRRWKRYGLPIQERPGGRPAAISTELDLWLVKFTENRKEIQD
jgi:predicted site-specific integrase-resolvase